MIIHPRRYNIALLGSLVWLVIVILLYYYVHRPITPAFMSAFGGALVDSASTLLFVIIAGGVGRTIRHRIFDLSALSIPEQIAIDALGGFGILALFILIIGAVNLSMISIALLLLVIGIVTYRHIWSWIQDIQQWIHSWHFDTTWKRGLALFIGINLALGWLMALLPPTAFDTLTYHLVGPKLWVAEGRFVHLPHNHFFAFPALLHTLYSGQMALLLGRITAAATLQLAITLLGLCGLVGYASRRFSRNAGMFCTAVFLSGTSFWLLLSWAYVDLVVMAFAAISFIAIDEWRANRYENMQWLTLAAIFVGFTLSNKYNAFAWAIIMGLYILNYRWRTGWKASIKDSFLYAVIVIIVLSPWLMRNIMMYSNPIYPFGPPTGEWDELSNQFYFPDNREFLEERWWFIAFMPLTATFLGVGGTGLFDLTIGPLYLMLCPLLLWTWQSFEPEARTRIKSISFLIAWGFIFWTFTALRSHYGLQTRLVSYLFPPLIVMAAVAFEQLKVLPPKPLNVAFVIRALVAFVLVLTLINHFVGRRQREGVNFIENTTTQSHFIDQRGLEYLAGILNQREFLEHRLGWYSKAIDAVNALPDGSHILFLWETRSLYCDEPRLYCEEDTILMRWWHDRRDIGDGTAQAILDSWQQRGITHILVWETGRDYEFRNTRLFTEGDKTEWEKIPPLLEIAWQAENIYTLYALPSR